MWDAIGWATLLDTHFDHMSVRARCTAILLHAHLASIKSIAYNRSDGKGACSLSIWCGTNISGYQYQNQAISDSRWHQRIGIIRPVLLVRQLSRLPSVIEGLRACFRLWEVL